ncbi:hypothetical protein BGZ93_006928 [Podila epicladia]|nr:hypothetical protein BGZ92_004391 [Podila epicladia]KAG0094656.1 hypothetical protein BGZ93_006928 [Podila epicladia]
MSSSTEPTSCSLSNPSFFFGKRFSLNEPYYLFNFDINPNTSVFTVTFLTGLVLQIVGFYLFKTYVPSLSRQSRKDRRGLSWVLTLFSSIVLFTGTFTLSTNMKWRGGDHPNGSPSVDGQQYDSKFLLLSLRNFPQESDVAVAYSAYFVSYLICDLVLGMIHYRAYLDPLSGWFHHLGYLGVVSNATLQRNVSTLFAIGTPIEATGHIFPHLRSDVLFAVSFFLVRIVYPIIMLPELYLNVEARLCWKVAVMALLIHIHWFHKFVQQQIRYHHARQLKKQQDEQTRLPQTQVKQVKQDELKFGLVQEYPLVHKTIDRAHKRASFEANDMAMTGVPNAIEFNGSRRRRTGPYTSTVTSSDYDSPLPSIVLPVDQDYGFYAPLLRSTPKTFSAVVHRRSDSQKASGVSEMGLSRASSMRDSKKRISLSAIQFEDPKKIQPRKATTATENREEDGVDGSATVVQRSPVVRSEDDVPPRRHVAKVFDTVRARGVAVNA